MIFKLILYFFLSLNLVHASNNDVITVGTFLYPPYHNEKGGFLNDFYQAIFKAVDRNVKFIYQPLRRSEANFIKGEVDLFSSHVLVEAEHLKLVDRLNILRFSASFFYLQSKGNFNNLESLKGHVCGVIQNSPYQKLYEKNGIRQNFLKDPETLLKMVLLGRVTAFESTFLTGINYIKKNTKVDNFDYFHFDVLSSGPAVLKTNKRRDELLKLIDTGYKRIVENGELIKILEKYWGVDNIPRAILPNDLKHLGKDQPKLMSIPITI